MKHEKITVPFADRCKEYQDAGIPLKPTTIQTNRFKFGAYWVTAHIYEGQADNLQVDEVIYLN